MVKNLSFLVLIVFCNVFHYLFFSHNKDFKTTTVIIEQGMKINEISEMLYKKKLINSEFAFDLWIKLNFLEKKSDLENLKLLEKTLFITLLKH